MGVAKFLVGKETALRLDFDDPRESFLLRGKFARAEFVEGRKELLALAIQFDEAAVPMGYKIRLNEFMSVVRADNRPDQSQGEQAHTDAAKANLVNAQMVRDKPSAEKPAAEPTETNTEVAAE
jgi:hypothetical protein